MQKKLISTGSIFEEKAAFSRAVVVDKTVYVSGCTGYNYATMEISDDIVDQTEQTFRNIAAVLEEANASFEDVVCVHYIITDASEWDKCWPTIRKYFGEVRPACTVYCAGLVNDQIKIEIEVTAVLP